jgi:hypothetical protein
MDTLTAEHGVEPWEQVDEAITLNREIGHLQRRLEKGAVLEEVNEMNTGAELEIKDFTVGRIVTWKWTDGLCGVHAKNSKLRPIGRVVDRNEYPYMACELAVAILDDPSWVIDPRTALEKSIKFFASD